MKPFRMQVEVEIQMSLYGSVSNYTSPQIFGRSGRDRYFSGLFGLTIDMFRVFSTDEIAEIRNVHS